jgi:hypothetical protein
VLKRATSDGMLRQLVMTNKNMSAGCQQNEGEDRIDGGKGQSKAGLAKVYRLCGL